MKTISDQFRSTEACTRPRYRLRSALWAAALAFACVFIARADHVEPDPHQGPRYPSMSKATSPGGVVASISQQASDIGVAVLDAGGNAMDAAVATVFALGVARPDNGGIGGAGFLLYRSRNGEVAALDFREIAPAAVVPTTFAGPGMHKDPNTFYGPQGSGHLAIGVPGTVAGMAAALERFGSGKFTLAELIAPAEKLAYDGPTVTYELGFFAFFNRERLTYYPETAAIYGAIEALYFSKQPMVQRDHARSLALIATFGPDAFYKTKPGGYPAFTFNGHDYPAGPSIADHIIADMALRPTGDEYQEPTSPTFNPTLIAKFGTEAHDKGIMTYSDLANYEVQWREPLSASFGDYQVYSMPPPASGVTVIETLNILAGFPVGSNTLDPADSLNADTSWAQSSANHIHVLAEAQKIAFADRDAFLADPAFCPVPTGELTSENYAAQRRQDIGIVPADFEAKQYAPGPFEACGAQISTSNHGSHTNHISVIDKHGNAVAVTSSLNSSFGSVVVPKGAGFLLNDELRDFNLGLLVCDGGNNIGTNCDDDSDCPGASCSNDPGTPGPGTANEALGGKRPRSAQSPTIVVKNGKPVLVVGGSGGPTIIMGVVESIVNLTAFSRTVFHAIDDERIDAVAWPGFGMNLGLEDRVPAVVEMELQDRMHTTQRVADDGLNNGYTGLPNIMAAGIDLAAGLIHAVADPRQQRNFERNDEEKGAAGQAVFAVSRKNHGAAGIFEVDLPLIGEPGIECRRGGENGNHQIVVTFANAVTVNEGQNPQATLTAPNGGSVDTVAVNNAVVTVALKNVGNEQTLTLTLNNVDDGTNTVDVVIPIGVLLGDTTANGSVNSSDIAQTKSRSGQTAAASSFRSDVNVNGVINASDISTVKSRSGTALP